MSNLRERKKERKEGKKKEKILMQKRPRETRKPRRLNTKCPFESLHTQGKERGRGGH